MREGRLHRINSYFLTVLTGVLLLAKPLHFGLVDHTHQMDHHHCQGHSHDHDYRLTDYVKHCLVGEYEYYPVVKPFTAIFPDRKILISYYYPEFDPEIRVFNEYQKSSPRAPPVI